MKKLTSLSFAAITVFLSATALILSTVAYGQTSNPLYQHLPPSADHIYSIRLGQIITKGDLTGLLTTLLAKDSNAVKFISDPAAAGVDLDHEILIAQTTAGGTGSDTISYTQILIPLIDSSKFRTVLSGVIPTLHITPIPGKGNTMSAAKNSMAWNDRLVVVTMASIPSKDSSTPEHLLATNRVLSQLATEKSLAALAGFSGTPWLTDQRFVTGFSTQEDIHTWSEKTDLMSFISKFAKKMAAKNPAMHGQSFPDYSNLGKMPHPPVLSTFNFENGRIFARMTTYNKPEDAALLHHIYDRPINKDLLARVPAGLLLGFSAVHFNPAAFPDLMDKYHTRQLLDSLLGKHGLTINDVSNVFGGDFLFAALGDTTATTDTAKKRFDFYLVVTLGDRSKLTQLSAKLMAGAKDDPAKTAKMKKLSDKMVIHDNMLVVSNTREMAQKYFDNQARRPTDLIPGDKTFQCLAVDLKAVSAFITVTQSNNPKSMVFARILEKLDKVELTTHLSDDNNTVTTFQIATGDPSTNSLKTLVGLMH